MGQDEGERSFAICIRNEGAEDLEIGKVYQVLRDDPAGGVGFIRVVDESGEDYPYPADHFVPIVLPREAERALVEALPSVSAARP